MKKLIVASAILVFTALSYKAVAQDDEQTTPRSPRWISEKGYWVVESNVHTPYHSIIHFYNNDNAQVYKEEVNGVKINLEKSRTKMRLKKILEQSIVAWEKDHSLKENEQWVVNALK